MKNISLPLLTRAAGLAWCGLALLLAAGCASTSEAIRRKAGDDRYFVPTNFSGDVRLPVNLRRVVMLPVHGGTIVPPEMAASIEAVFSAQLQKEIRFEVVRLSREDCQRRFGQPAFASVGALPHDFISTLSRDFAADAILFVDVTAFRGYRPLMLGIRAKLATVEQTRLIWTFDEVFSADDPAVGNSVRLYYGAADPSGIPLDARHGGLQSPGKFAAYVAAATFDTLPPR